MVKQWLKCGNKDCYEGFSFDAVNQKQLTGITLYTLLNGNIPNIIRLCSVDCKIKLMKEWYKYDVAGMPCREIQIISDWEFYRITQGIPEETSKKETMIKKFEHVRNSKKIIEVDIANSYIRKGEETFDIIGTDKKITLDKLRNNYDEVYKYKTEECKHKNKGMKSTYGTQLYKTECKDCGSFWIKEW